MVKETQITGDIEYLAGVLVHRGANTRGERSAAEYIRDRLSESTPDVAIEDFHSIDSALYVYASAYAEFLVVAVLAHFWPWIAFCYGSATFVLYLAEVTGYRTISRLMPHYESQNVVARYLATQPKRLVIVTAHYDSPKDIPFMRPQFGGWLRRAHLALVLCMVAVLASCAAEALGSFDSAEVRLDLYVRWSAVACLLSAAAVVTYFEMSADYARGANDNASGVAALLQLAGRLRDHPSESCDVWLVATGSKESGLHGMHHLLAGGGFDRHTTYFLNLDRVGQGRLNYVTSEGLLHLFRSPKELRDTAAAAASPYAAVPGVLVGWPTDASLALARGYKALGITAVEDDEWSDTGHEAIRSGEVSAETVSQTAQFAEAILRNIASLP